MANDNPSVEEMRDSFDSEAEVDQSHDPELEAMRSEITGESAMMPENLDADNRKPLAQRIGEGVFDMGVQAVSSIPIVTPLSDATLAAGYTLANIGQEGYNPIEEYGQQFGNIKSAREALSSQAQERSPVTSFIGSMGAASTIPTAGAGILGKAAYEGGLALTDAMMRGRTPSQAGGEMASASAFQTAMGALPWLRGILPGTKVTPDIVNKVYARGSSMLRPSNKLSAAEIGDLYGDVEGRRLVRAYDKSELSRKKGDESPGMTMIQNTKEVAENLESSFRSLQKSFGSRYAKFRERFIAPASYQDFMTTADNIHYLQSMADEIQLRPYNYSSTTKKAIRDNLKMFEGGIRSDFKSLKNAKTFSQLSNKNKTENLRKLTEKYKAAKTGAEQDRIVNRIMLLNAAYQKDLKLATRLGKETMIRFRKNMGDLIDDISKSRDPSIFHGKKEDIILLKELENKASQALGKDYIRSDSLVNANIDYSEFQNGVDDLFKYLAKSKKDMSYQDMRKGSVDPYKLYGGINSQGKQRNEEFWAAVDKMKSFVTDDTKNIEEVIEKAGIKPAFIRMQQLVDVIAKKAQIEKARTAGGPSSMGVDEGVRTMLLASGEKKKIAYAMLIAPIANPLGWSNMVDNFAEAFSTKANRVNPGALSKWWDKASKKVWKQTPGIFGGPKKGQLSPEMNILPSVDMSTPKLISNIPIDPRGIAARISRKSSSRSN